MLRSISDCWGGLESRETDIVSTKNANDLAAAVQLDKEPLVEVLFTASSALVRRGGWEEACAADGAIRQNLSPTISMEERAHTFLSSGCAGAMVNSSSKRGWRVWCWCWCWFPTCNGQGRSLPLDASAAREDGARNFNGALLARRITCGAPAASTSDKIRTELWRQASRDFVPAWRFGAPC